MNYRRKMYSVLRGPFSEDGILEYVRELIGGRGRTTPLRGAALPAVADIEPWDGKDGKVSHPSTADSAVYNLKCLIFSFQMKRTMILQTLKWMTAKMNFEIPDTHILGDKQSGCL